MIEGRILKGIGGFYYVLTLEGLIECRACGKFRLHGEKPMIGDFVKVENDTVVEILPRKNSLVRPPVCNLDQIVIVVSVASPQPDYYLIDKLILSAICSDIKPIICINKTDLGHERDIIEIYGEFFECYAVSALAGEGIDKLPLDGVTTAFAGNSGVGKSSLLNALGFNNEVGEVSRINRGKHTTRHSELFLFRGGYAVDTPGFSVLDVGGLAREDILRGFPEFERFESCRFADCDHISSDGCVVKGNVNESRYRSYVELMKCAK